MTSPLTENASLSAKPPEPESTNAEGEIWVVYDGDCPFCATYVKLTRLREAAGTVHLINARDGGPLVDEITAAGLDLNEGMVMKMNGTLYHGDECIHMLAVMTSSVGPFNKAMAALFKSPERAKALYPFLRAGRNAALKLLGKKQIKQ